MPNTVDDWYLKEKTEPQMKMVTVNSKSTECVWQ